MNAETRVLKEQLLNLRVQTEGPELWKQLIKELQINVDSLTQIGLSGSLSDNSHPSDDSYRVTVRRMTTFPSETFTDLFYKPGDPMVRVCFMDGRSTKLTFGTLNGDKMVLWWEGPVNLEKAARFIVEPMARSLIGQRAMSARSLL